MKFEDDELEIGEGRRYRIETLIDNLVGHADRVADILNSARRNLPEEECSVFRERWDEVVRHRWPRLRAPLLAQFQNVIVYGPGDKILDCAPPALGDVEYLTACLREFCRQTSPKSSERAKCLEFLKRFVCWTGPLARQFFEALGTDGEPSLDGSAPNLLAASCAYGPQDRVCLALAFLMHQRNRLIAAGREPATYEREWLEKDQRHIAALPEGAIILSLRRLLQDLPTGHYHHKAPWSEFGPDEKAAWRGEAAAAVTDDPARQGLLEYLIWQTRITGTSSASYSDMEVLLIALCATERNIDFVASLARHPSRLVQVRSAALLSRLGRSSIPLLATPQDGYTAAAGAQALAAAGGSELAGRTWMRNKAVERVIYGATQRIEQNFAARYPGEWRLDEEVHLATLLREIEHSFKDVNGLLDVLATGGVAAPRIDFSFRQISKSEEGAAGVGAPRFSVDVAFIVHVTDAGRTVSRRAAFVQCKKLRARGDEVWEPSFAIDRTQCDELIAQTESSFYMFLSPPFAGGEIWMTPARLVRNLTDLHGSGRKSPGGRGAVPRVPAYFASRSLAQWLTYDVFGLWTGDERKEILDKAEPRERGLSPRFVASVRIRSNPTRDEAPGR